MNLRVKKIASQILKEVSQMIHFELKDPKIGFVTLMDCIVSNDYSYAKIFVTFMDGRDKEEQLQLLNGHARQFRGELGKRMMIRKIPEISFIIDESYEQGKRIDDILNSIKKD